MKHNELVTNLADRTNQPKDIVKKCIDELGEVVKAVLSGGGKIKLPGIGIFTTRQLKPKVGRNPKTGEAVQVPARKRVIFDVNSGLKDRVNGNV